MKIYKYFSPGVFDLVFARDGFCGVKCSTPDSYNDPYELFLGVDTGVGTDLLAAYQELVQNLPQLPTTCFSKSPVVTPMWAHYAANHTGFVVEFDSDLLEEKFPEASLGELSYKDAPDGNIEGALEMAAGTKKPRHTIWLQQIVMREAYFSKQTAWSYEEEYRLVDHNDYVEDINGNKVLFVPMGCVSSIIVGKSCPADISERSLKISQEKGVSWFKEAIGRVQAKPYFLSATGKTCIFHDGEIAATEWVCESCGEPVPEGDTDCAWCAITEAHRTEAARSNPLRVLDAWGLLDDYMDQIDGIERRHRESRREK